MREEGVTGEKRGQSECGERQGKNRFLTIKWSVNYQQETKESLV